MLKGVVGLVTVLVIAGPALAQDPPAQNSPPAQNPAGAAAVPESSRSDDDSDLSQADFNVLADARIGMAKSMLQMTPQQAELWPSIEEAMRNVLEVRYRGIARLKAIADQTGGRVPDPVSVIRSRGEALTEQGDRLRKLAEAWLPLYQTLTPEQKDRMRLVASHILCETRGLFGCRLGNEEGEGEEQQQP